MATESMDAGIDARGAFVNADSAAGRHGARESREEPRSARRKTRRELQTAQPLGWLSIGLGLTALLAPRTVGALTGMPNRSGLLRLVGVRELASGFGLLTQPQATPWLWSRVAGDAMDLALIGSACRPTNPTRGRALGALGVVAAITAIDVMASVRSPQSATNRSAAGREPLSEHTVAVLKSPEECYAFWRDLSNLSRVSEKLESVVAVDERRSHWVMKGPRGTRIEWDSELTEDRPNERLAWRSLPGSDVTHAGVVRFAPAAGNRGTFVTVMMHYQAGARAGRSVSHLLRRDPDTALREDLRRFKSLIEAGEIPTTRGQPSGRRSLLGRLTPEGRKSREGVPT